MNKFGFMFCFINTVPMQREIFLILLRQILFNKISGVCMTKSESDFTKLTE